MTLRAEAKSVEKAILYVRHLKGFLEKHQHEYVATFPLVYKE